MADPAARLGVMADVQYGDLESEGEWDFRGSLGRLGRVLAALDEAGPARLVQLGDLIEGYPGDEAASRADLERVLAPLEGSGRSVVHVVGNHCLRAGRAALLERLGLAAPHRSLRMPGWRLVVLDTCDVSLAGRRAGERAADEAAAYLAAHPPELVPRARSWNGAVGERQLAWLAEELARAEAAGERALVLGHHPLVPGAARENYLCWNGEEVAALLAGSPATVAYLAGHDHRGGHAVWGGVHHLTLPAVLAGPNAAVLELSSERIELRGIGAVADRTLAR